ncbi:histone H3-like centromeric protein CSE4 [Contarinia nasturtii]|uniref:histone H3-like centromeric protein CSE4 n=1 Tax=Contarinia nasturtii TaxID=265458 RepID=UPI0012D47929|nr:histone H3-like centromeric protein CSE4 [Contarinia nasturtii]
MDVVFKLRGKELPDISKQNTRDTSQKESEQERSPVKNVRSPTQRESPEKSDQNESTQNVSKSHATETEDRTPKKDKNVPRSKAQDDLGESTSSSDRGPANAESPEENDENESNQQVEKSNDTSNEDEPLQQEQNHSPPGNADNLNDAATPLDADPLTVQHSDGSKESIHMADGTPNIIILPRQLPLKPSSRKLPGEKVRQRTKRRIRVLKEIKRLQESWNLLIPRLPFQRLVREIMQEHKKHDYRLQAAAVGALHEAAEYVLVEIFQESWDLVAHRSMKTLKEKDYRMANRIRENFDGRFRT